MLRLGHQFIMNKIQAVGKSNFRNLRVTHCNDCFGLNCSSVLLYDLKRAWSPTQDSTTEEALPAKP